MSPRRTVARVAVDDAAGQEDPQQQIHRAGAGDRRRARLPVEQGARNCRARSAKPSTLGVNAALEPERLLAELLHPVVVRAAGQPRLPGSRRDDLSMACRARASARGKLAATDRRHTRRHERRRAIDAPGIPRMRGETASHENAHVSSASCSHTIHFSAHLRGGLRRPSVRASASCSCS